MTRIDPETRNVFFDGGESVRARTIIVATGVERRRLTVDDVDRHFANHARKVTLVVRGGSLEKSMSHYLIEQLRAKSNIAVQLRSEVVGIRGDTHLTGIDIRNGQASEARRHDCGGLFVFIGAKAETAGLPNEIARDATGRRAA